MFKCLVFSSLHFFKDLKANDDNTVLVSADRFLFVPGLKFVCFKSIDVNNDLRLQYVLNDIIYHVERVVYYQVILYLQNTRSCHYCNLGLM